MERARRQAYLDAMGIQAWVSRDRLSSGQTQPDERQAKDGLAGTERQGRLAAPEPETVQQAEPRAGGFPSDMLRAALRGGAQTPPVPEPVASRPPARETSSPPPAAGQTGDVSGLDWAELAARVASCRACDLHQGRTQAVFGVGDQRARLMIVGEAPGADEDRQGEPFVGRAGQLLNAMLAAIGLARGQVYIANILKCRPPGNRDPQISEATACRGFLDRQIALVQPDLILCLGAVAARNLLATELPVGKLRGCWHELPGGQRVAVTYHPAYLLRRPEEKAKAWQDLQRVAGLLRG